MKKMKLMYLVMSLLCLSLVLGLQELSIESSATLRGIVNITGIVNYGDDPVSVTAGTFALGENTYTIESTMPNQTEFLLELDSTSIPDGDYNLTFNVSQDSSTSLISVQEVIVDNIDTVPPDLTSLTIDVHTFLVDGTVFSNMNELKTVIVEATDEFTGINSISALFENETYQLVILLVNGTSEVNFSTFSDGNYTIVVNVTDNSNNIVTQEYNLVIDRIKPAINVRCNPEDVIEGNRVSCTCSASDSYLVDGWSFAGGAREESTTASNPQNEPYLSSICSAIDLAGNRGFKQGKWKVLVATSASGSGSSSGGGSSGGSASLTSDNIDKKVWSYIPINKKMTMSITKLQIPIKEINFAADTKIYDASIRIEVVKDFPTNVKQLDKKVYKKLKIQSTNIKNTKDGFQIIFEVENSWLQNKKVRMYHLDNNNIWIQLPTVQIGKKDSVTIFLANTQSFSYFAIASVSNNNEIVKRNTNLNNADTYKNASTSVAQDTQIKDVQIEAIKINEVVNTQKDNRAKHVLIASIAAFLIGCGIGGYYYSKRKKKLKTAE